MGQKKKKVQVRKVEEGLGVAALTDNPTLEEGPK